MFIPLFSPPVPCYSSHRMELDFSSQYNQMDHFITVSLLLTFTQVSVLIKMIRNCNLNHLLSWRLSHRGKLIKPWHWRLLPNLLHQHLPVENVIIWMIMFSFFSFLELKGIFNIFILYTGLYGALCGKNEHIYIEHIYISLWFALETQCCLNRCYRKRINTYWPIRQCSTHGSDKSMTSY